MKDSRLGCRSVANQLAIVFQHPGDLPDDAGIRPLIASQIKKVHSGLAVELRALEFIATNQVQGCPLVHQRWRQPQDVRSVATAGQQGHRDTIFD